MFFFLSFFLAKNNYLRNNYEFSSLEKMCSVYSNINWIIHQKQLKTKSNLRKITIKSMHIHQTHVREQYYHHPASLRTVIGPVSGKWLPFLEFPTYLHNEDKANLLSEIKINNNDKVHIYAIFCRQNYPRTQTR